MEPETSEPGSVPSHGNSEIGRWGPSEALSWRLGLMPIKRPCVTAYTPVFEACRLLCPQGRSRPYRCK